MRNLAQWVAYRTKPRRNKPGKLDKVPVNSHTGGDAKTNDAATWSTFEAACEHARLKNLPGVGFVFTGEDSFAGVDLDNCINAETGEVEAWALAIIEQLGSYTERSPSGTGIHIIGNARLPAEGRKRGRIEMYDSGRFFTVTGCSFHDPPLPLADCTSALAALHRWVFGGAETKQREPNRQPARTDLPAEDEPLIERAMLAANGRKFRALWEGDTSEYGSQSEADLALVSQLAFWTQGDAGRIDRLFRKSGLMRDKWDERRAESTYGRGTIEKALDGRTQFYKPQAERSRKQEKSRKRVGSPKQQGSAEELRLTDTGNAERLAQMKGEDLRFLREKKQWRRWCGSHWVEDPEYVMQATKDVARSYYIDAAKAKTDRQRDALAAWAKSSESLQRRVAAERLARIEPKLLAGTGSFDADPWLLNCKNGTLDLRIGTLRPHGRADFITRMIEVRYDEAGRCPTWHTFLERVIPDAAVRSYLQRAVGYTLTASIVEHALFFLFGPGRNGKSVFLSVIQKLLGPGLAVQAARELLLRKRGSVHPAILMPLHGARMAVCIELGPNEAFDEELVKWLTGGDRLTARGMGENWWEFDPSHKLWMAANHKPLVRGNDSAVWSRFHVIEFPVVIPDEEQNKELIHILLAERPGILSWAVQGCLEWQAHGLMPPEAVLQARSKYHRQMDAVGEFLAARTRTGSSSSVGATDLFAEYLDWCASAEVRPCGQKAFGEDLTARGLVRGKSHGRKAYLGIAVTTRGAEHGGRSGRWGPGFRSPTSDSPHEGERPESRSPSSRSSPARPGGARHGGVDDALDDLVDDEDLPDGQEVA